MICPTCQTELPALSLACAACMRVEHYAQLEQSEIELMPRILGGELDLKLLRPGKAGYRHLGFHAGYRHLGFHDGLSTNAYCHARLGSPFISYAKFKDRPDNLCAKCASTLKEFLKKAGIPVTR